MKKILLLSAAVLALQVVPALAEEGPAGGEGKKAPRHEGMFEKQDTNGDGVVSETEFLERGKVMFKEMDGNGDGNVTKEEARAHFEKKHAEREAKRAEMKAKKDAAPKEAPAPAPAQ